MKKDIQYTMLGFYLSEEAKDYIIIEEENVHKSLLDEEETTFDEVSERFLDDGGSSNIALVYDQKKQEYFFFRMFVRNKHKMVIPYDHYRYRMMKFKKGMKKAFLDATEQESMEIDFSNYMKPIDLDTEFQDVNDIWFLMDSMIEWEEEVETKGEKVLVSEGTIYV